MTDNDREVKNSSDFEDMEALLSREVGRIGRFQIRVLALLLVATAISGISTNEFIFTIARINTRCFIPECESFLNNAEFSPSWISNVIPSTGGGFDNCQRFANISTTVFGNDTCPATLFDQNIVLECDQYVYENTYSAVHDLDLACSEWSRSLVGSLRTVGAFVSLPLAGFVSDRWGRRTAITIICFNTAWIGLMRYFASSYIGYVIAVFTEAAFGGGAILACIYVLIMEITPPKYRVFMGAMSNSFFSVGQILLGLIAWGLPYWKHLILALYSPQLLAITYFWIVPESIRWYISKRQFDKVEESLKQIAKTNGREISEKSLMQLRQAAKQNIKETVMSDGEDQSWLIVKVVKSKPMLLRCLVSPVWWITMTMIYYGLSINAVNISGNSYVNYIVVSAVEIPGFWTAMLLVDRIGRKPVLMISFFICAAGQLAYIFIPNEVYALSLTVYLISKYAIASAVTTIYLYTSELFPTRYRQSLFSYCSMLGRIGSIIAPLTPALGAMVWGDLPFALFGSMALLSGVLVLLVPETRGCHLPDTLEEAAGLGTRHKDDTKKPVAITRL